MTHKAYGSGAAKKHKHKKKKNTNSAQLRFREKRSLPGASFWRRKKASEMKKAEKEMVKRLDIYIWAKDIETQSI